MLNFSYKILKYKKTVIFIFAVLIVICGILAFGVKVDYDLTSYIPDEAESTVAIRLVHEEYQDEIPNLELMVSDISINEALEMKKELAKLDFVQNVIWLDDQADAYSPTEVQSEKAVAGFYKDRAALFRLTLISDNYGEALAEIKKITGEDAAMTGAAVDMASANSATSDEMASIMMFSIPIALLILVFATSSWYEPFLFLLSIMVGVVLNLGTNIFFEKISFITQSVGAVLQLAVSMDYAVFVLERYKYYTALDYEPEDAMARAMSHAFLAVSSSAMTTVFGFLSLLFMRFKLGPDLGIVLAKGVFFSMFSVLIFMPCFALLTEKLMVKTAHRNFLPDMGFLANTVSKLSIPVLIIFLITIVPVYKAQTRNEFLYGMGDNEPGSKEAEDLQSIEDKFGVTRQILVMVPKGRPDKEIELVKALEDMPETLSVMGYANAVGTGLPAEFIPESQKGLLFSENYSRYIVVNDLPVESPQTFTFSENIRAKVKEIYPEDSHVAGESMSLLDMRDTIVEDNKTVNALAIAAVAMILLISFKSLIMPVLLVATIEYAIWLNLSVPYFADTKLNYIGYLVISTIQLGATVDYAILMSQRYLEERKEAPAREAARKAVHVSVPAILPPAMILTVVGFVLSKVSSIAVVSQLGTVLGRGAFLSLLATVLLLPALLRICDPLIKRFTMNTKDFYKKAKNDKNKAQIES